MAPVNFRNASDLSFIPAYSVLQELCGSLETSEERRKEKAKEHAEIFPVIAMLKSDVFAIITSVVALGLAGLLAYIAKRE